MTYTRGWDEARFWATAVTVGECWEWTGPGNGVGYGVSHRYQGERYAHRIAYMLTKGPIPAGLTIDHLCRNRGCINPDHLEAVPHRENVLRGTAPVAAHARKTHCPRGHEYDRVKANGARGCRTCEREREQAERHPREIQATCHKGHPYALTEANGARRCVECRREAYRRYAEKRVRRDLYGDLEATR